MIKPKNKDQQHETSLIEVIAPNFSRRLSGVTSTVVRLVPQQAETIRIVSVGNGLPNDIPRISIRQLMLLPRRREGENPYRIWHARRNIEMLAGLFLKVVARKKLKLVFTSASQRSHTAYTRLLVSQMDAVIATSEKTRSYLKREAIVIPHGIDVATFAPTADKSTLKKQLGLPPGPVIGCFGRIRWQKGTDIFVDALLSLLPHHPHVTGLIIGRATKEHKTYRDELQQRVDTAGLSDRIIFLNEVPTWDTARWYKALDLYVAPQRWEGFGLTPLEAMACGVPAITTRAGAFEDLILDGSTGRLLPTACAKTLAAALNDAITHPSVLARWSRRAREHAVKNYRLQSEAAALNALYRMILKLSPTLATGAMPVLESAYQQRGGLSVSVPAPIHPPQRG